MEGPRPDKFLFTKPARIVTIKSNPFAVRRASPVRRVCRVFCGSGAVPGRAFCAGGFSYEDHAPCRSSPYRCRCRLAGFVQLQRKRHHSGQQLLRLAPKNAGRLCLVRRIQRCCVRSGRLAAAGRGTAGPRLCRDPRLRRRPAHRRGPAQRRAHRGRDGEQHLQHPSPERPPAARHRFGGRAHRVQGGGRHHPLLRGVPRRRRHPGDRPAALRPRPVPAAADAVSGAVLPRRRERRLHQVHQRVRLLRPEHRRQELLQHPGPPPCGPPRQPRPGRGLRAHRVHLRHRDQTGCRQRRHRPGLRLRHHLLPLCGLPHRCRERHEGHRLRQERQHRALGPLQDQLQLQLVRPHL